MLVGINLKGVIIIVGNYGSGKTEVSINLAVYRHAQGIEVKIGDLDLVNPYFRTREVKTQLAELGIEVVTPPKQYLQADLPILSPKISGMIRKPSELTILDAGGDDVGATVLASLAESMADRQIAIFQVVNPYRPYTDTIAGCEKIRAAIEKAGKIKITGLIGNANLIDQTTIEDIYKGYDFVREYAVKSQLPLEFITVSRKFYSRVDNDLIDCPVLPITRQLVPPWIKAQEINTAFDN